MDSRRLQIQVLNLLEPRCKIPDSPDDFYGNTNYSTAKNVSECYATTNGTTRACTEWVYDTSELSSSLLSTFNMVCDDEFVRSHMMLCQYVGLFLGSLTSGLLCDTLGRRPVLSMALFLMFVCNLTRSWSNSVALCGFLLVGNGWFGVVVYTSAFILATELVEPSKRVFANFVVYLSYCMGYMALLLLAYFYRDWRELGWASSVPVGLGHIVLFFIVESPRWLIAKGKDKHALSIFRNAAKENAVSFDTDIADIKVPKPDDVSFFKAIQHILRSKTLLIRGVILSFNWFTVNITYYGISFKVGNFGGNIHINFLISTTAEIIALFICLFFNKWAGRKNTFTVSIWICGLACLCTIFTSLYAGKEYHWITIGLAMIGKLFISVSFFNAYLMSAENFPTVVRTTAMGVCSASGRIGSMVSAYIGDLGVLIDTQYGVALPLVIFGAFAVSSGVLSFFLPETHNTKLTESIEDAEELKRKREVNGLRKDDEIGQDKRVEQKLLETLSDDTKL